MLTGHISLTKPKQRRLIVGRPAFNGIGFIWSVCFFGCSCVLALSFYSTEWLTGGKICLPVDAAVAQEPTNCTEFSIGLFRRCGYIYYDKYEEANKISSFCARYANFNEIPSVWYKICTVILGGVISLACVVAIVLIPSLLCSGLLSEVGVRAIGTAQTAAGLLVLSTTLFYPLGWHTPEFKDYCGPLLRPFNTGDRCSPGWPYYACISSSCLMIACTFLSCKSLRAYPNPTTCTSKLPTLDNKEANPMCV